MTEQICLEASHDTQFQINVVLHIFILFTILSIFYLSFISKVETDALNYELDQIIDEGIGANVKKLPNNLKRFLKEVPIEQIQKLYNQPDPVRELNNQWVSRSIITMSLTLLVSLLLIVYVLKSGCNTCIDYSALFWENLITFLFVGTVEGAFFIYIAFKYIPVAPSFLMQKAKEDMVSIF